MDQFAVRGTRARLATRRSWRWVASILMALSFGFLGGLFGGRLASEVAPSTQSCAPADGLGGLSGPLAQAAHSVVLVVATTVTMEGATSFSGETTATGTVLTGGGFVATSAHVLAGAQTVSVTLPCGDQVVAAIVGVDSESDLALLKVEGVELTPIEVGSSASLAIGDVVVSLGNALALRGGPTATLGIVSALDRSIATGDRTLDHLIQTDAAINPGASGGPLVDRNGFLVGINSGRSYTAEGISFAVPVDVALPLLESLAGRELR